MQLVRKPKKNIHKIFFFETMLLKNLKNLTSATQLAAIKKIQDFRSVFKEEEVPDPYFGGEEGFDNVLDILEDSVTGFLNSIS